MPWRPDEAIQLGTGIAGLVATVTATATNTPYGVWGTNFWAPQRSELLAVTVFGVLSLTVIGGVALQLLHHEDESSYNYNITREKLEGQIADYQNHRTADLTHKLKSLKAKRKRHQNATRTSSRQRIPSYTQNY